LTKEKRLGLEDVPGLSIKVWLSTLTTRRDVELASIGIAVFRHSQSKILHFTSPSRSHDVESGDADQLQHAHQSIIH
jgi:hypothetical protein